MKLEHRYVFLLLSVLVSCYLSFNPKSESAGLGAFVGLSFSMILGLITLIIFYSFNKMLSSWIFLFVLIVINMTVGLFFHLGLI